MAVSMMNFTSRGEFLKEVLGGDFSQVAWYLSTWTSVTAAIEFILNPTLGKLSDAYGRKPFMVLAPYAAIVLKSWVLMAPSVFSLTVERIVCDGLRTMSGTTMGSAAITDIVPKDQIGKAMSGLWSWMGLAIIGAPLLASRLSTRGTYQVAILVALGQLVADQFYLKETLKKEEMKPFPGFANPFEANSYQRCNSYGAIAYDTHVQSDAHHDSHSLSPRIVCCPVCTPARLLRTVVVWRIFW